MNFNRDKTIGELSSLANEIQKLKEDRKQRRPLLIEFCGSPKSGKTTTITSLNIFLKRSGFSTKVLSERAGVCPIRNKTHPFFNIWTLTSAISETVELIEQGRDKVDIVIADRGIFDAISWFTWLNSNPNINSPYLSKPEFDKIKGFILLDIWKKYLDLIYVFKVNPDTSITREYSHLLTDERGSIMNKQVLNSFNGSVSSCISTYENHFRKIIEIQTDINERDNNPSLVSYEVTKEILLALKSLLIEKIGYVEKNETKFNYGLNSYHLLRKMNLKFGDRDKVENSDAIQPIPIAVITNKERNKVFVVKKSDLRTSKDSPEKEKTLLYVGGHVRIEDADTDNIDIIMLRALEREIQEEIGESFSIDQLLPYLIYTPDNPKSKKHIAVCYVIEMNLEEKRFKLRSDEFIMKTGKSISGRILPIKELLSGKNKFESWSTEILKKEFNHDIRQPDLFGKK